MNKITIAVGVGAAAVFLTGCGPEMAQVPYGSEEARWQKTLRENYSGYEAPRTAPPAIRDNVSERLLEEEQMRRNAQGASNSAAPAADNPTDDPARVVDNAAERPAVAEQQPPQPAPAAAPADDPAAAEGTYVVKSGDTLGAIAQKFYGDARRSDVIVRANPALRKNPNFLKPGMKLVIPKI